MNRRGAGDSGPRRPDRAPEMRTGDAVARAETRVI